MAHYKTSSLSQQVASKAAANNLAFNSSRLTLGKHSIVRFVGCKVILAITFLVLCEQSAYSANDYSPYIVSFCNGKIGKQVGSGECAHLATESLRVAGAEFLRSGMVDSPQAGDYVWGTLIKSMSYIAARDLITFSNPETSKCRAGDIIQYRLGSTGKTHHTSIVAAVNSGGYPTQVFQQNFNANRTVSKNTTNLFQLLRDRGGYLRIYRAKAPVNSIRTEFTLVNNAKTSSLGFSVNSTAYTIGGKNTATGFKSFYSTSSTVKVTVGGVAYTMSRRKGYEFYLSGGTVKLRALYP